MADALTRHVQARQSEPAREDQVKNNAGGFVFGVKEHTRLNRFLTLGTEGGTYYVSERDLTKDNASVVAQLGKASDPFLISHAREVSEAGRAPRNNPALFALATASSLGAVDYRQRALDVLPYVARTGHHILDFAKYASMQRGWGPQLVRGIQNWYVGQPVEYVAYQLMKYKQREGWSQRDLLRLVARKTKFVELTAEQKALFAYVMKGERSELLPRVVQSAAAAHATRNVAEWVRLIHGNRSLSHEMLPSEALASAEVWRALAEGGNLPLGALTRNLGRMTSVGALKPMDDLTRQMAALIGDGTSVGKARMHPINLLIAQRTYAQGHGQKGKGRWAPVSELIDALDAAFYDSFGTIVPSGKRTMIALDVSGSMADKSFTKDHEKLYERTCLVPRDITAAMSMAVAKTEPNYLVTAFSDQMQPITISPRQRLDDVARAMQRVPAGGTDCSLPMVWARQANIPVDTFQVWTDNETWGGRVHPHVALEQYRQATGINARLQVIGATATEFSVADPLDARQLDVAGFDAAVPRLLADHARGDL